MSGLLGQIIAILVAGLVIAGLAIFWGWAAQKNAETRSPEMQEKQDHACETCSLASMCSRMGQVEKDEPCSEREEKPELRLVK